MYKLGQYNTLLLGLSGIGLSLLIIYTVHSEGAVAGYITLVVSSLWMIYGIRRLAFRNKSHVFLDVYQSTL